MHLIITSPPYNIGKAYEKRTTNELYIEQQAATIAEAVRLLHPRGSICWQVGNGIEDGEVFPLDILLYPKFKDHGLKLRNRIVWTFGHGLHCQKRLSGRHETILWFTKSDDYTFNLDPIRVPSKYPLKKHFKGPNKGKVSSNPLGKNPSDVWDIPNVKSNHVEKTEHPCQFPVGLVERLVLGLTDKGDSVLDPYLGVGSTAVAAVKNGRNAYGCDVVQEYIDIAYQRLDALGAGQRPVAIKTIAFELPKGDRLSLAADEFPGTPNTTLPATLCDGETAFLMVSHAAIGNALLEMRVKKVHLTPICTDTAGNVYRGTPWPVDGRKLAERVF
ncbi:MULTISPECIES: site-specific DNA-methyltransferase [unclassified Bradyrhizobium]|uniref:DNA-methyltransferase n=1 Tax=unclassified Bradyrhizobium TaxID=2631580 RepID=UPI001CD61CBB|nr:MULTISPECIES: site-specific DNA-methyltransferase [unclassified Bradyrhizobium]